MPLWLCHALLSTNESGDCWRHVSFLTCDVSKKLAARDERMLVMHTQHRHTDRHKDDAGVYLQLHLNVWADAEVSNTQRLI